MTGSSRGAGSTVIDCVVETPKGSQNKLKFDPVHGRFRLSHVLPAGMVFPFDFGFLPGTVAQDGDPLDVLVLMDAPVPTGCVVATRLVGVMEVEQREQTGEQVRNDRLIGVAAESKRHAATRDLADVSPALMLEIEAFFAQYNQLDGKTFRVIHRRGVKAASALVSRAQAATGRTNSDPPGGTPVKP